MVNKFLALCFVSLILAIPAFAQSAQHSNMLTPENLEKESYRLWLECFQEWKQGKTPDVPNLGIVDNVDVKEAQRAHAVWERSKMRAFLTVAEKEMYQECLNWWRAKEQGQQMTAPILKYPNLFDEAQVKRIEAVWQQAYDKAHLTVFEQGAYQTWLDYYQALQQGGQPSLPELSINDSVKSQEAKKVQAVWTQAQARAQRKVPQAGQAQAQQAKQPSLQADNVAAISAGKTTDSLPDVVVDAATRQRAMGSIVPVLETTPPRNSNPQPVSGFNQPRGIAGVFSYAANPTQPGQMQTNTSETITANNNQIIAELNRETTQAKTAVNIDTAKHLVEKQDNRKRQTNSSAADSSAFHVVRRYSYGLQGPISMSQLINGQWVTSFFIYDGQGNVRALTDENGNVTDTYAYDAHGNLIDQTGNTPNTRLYHGEEYDADLGMYYLRARFLNTATGRFFNMDSSEGKNLIPLSLHKYLYANANPVNKIDPTGLSSIDFISATGLASVLSTVGTLNPHMIRAVYSNSITLHDNAQVLTGTGWTIGDATAVFQKASDFWRPYGINVQGSVSEFTCPTTSIDCQRLRGLLGGVGTYDSRSGASPTAENVSADYDWETHIIPLIPTLSKHNTIFIGFIAHPTIPGTAIVGRTNLSRSGQYTGVAVSLLASPDATKKELGSDTVLSIDLLGRFLAHEWGHTFGLPDSSLPNNLMNGGSFGPQLDPKTQVEEALKFTFEKY